MTLYTLTLVKDEHNNYEFAYTHESSKSIIPLPLEKDGAKLYYFKKNGKNNYSFKIVKQNNEMVTFINEQKIITCNRGNPKREILAYSSQNHKKVAPISYTFEG